MNVAVVIAGGSGQRMGQDIPKQFLNVKDKPIIIYTLEAFERHPDIDAIEVVCLEGWQEILKAYARQFGISKLRWVVNGGETGQESIRNGVYNLKNFCTDDDIVIIHDGIRPMIEDSILSDLLVKCGEYGNAVTSTPFREQIFVLGDNGTSQKFIPRESLVKIATPQAYKFKKLVDSYEKAFRENIGILGSSYTNTMMVELGEVLHLSAGSEKNIKLTTPEDIEIFKALLDTKKDHWLK